MPDLFMRIGVNTVAAGAAAAALAVLAGDVTVALTDVVTVGTLPAAVALAAGAVAVESVRTVGASVPAALVTRVGTTPIDRPGTMPLAVAPAIGAVMLISPDGTLPCTSAVAAPAWSVKLAATAGTIAPAAADVAIGDIRPLPA